MSVYLKVDGVTVASADAYTPGGADAEDEYNMLSLNTIQDLAVGQAVTIEAYMTTNAYFTATSANINIHFTGQALMLSEPTTNN